MKMAKWKEFDAVDYVHTVNIQEAARDFRDDILQDLNKKAKTINGSGIRPVQYMVIVKPDEVEKTTKGGIILPDTKVEKDEFQRMEGLLVAVSPMAFTFKDWPDGAEKPNVGDRVTFARYNATEITGRDGGKYWFMKDESILGVME